MLLLWTSCAIVDQACPRVEILLLKMKNVVIVTIREREAMRTVRNPRKSFGA
jgi:hypothetical protein